MNKNIALIGNPNCGKTTLFNTLTGTYQKTGNWTGVTTEKKEGFYKKDKSIIITDLPGLYSLDAKSEDERAVLKFIKNSPPSVIINVLDGTNLERNLYLTLELIKLRLPMVIAVNMYDDLIKNGIKLNCEKLSKLLGVKVLPVSALKKLNIDALISVALKAKPVINNLNVSKNYAFQWIETNVKEIVTYKQTKAELFTLKADGVLTHKIFGLPIFFAVIALVYFLSMKIGGFFGGYIDKYFEITSEKLNVFLTNNNCPKWLIGVCCKAVIQGIGTVASFLPQILVLFALMAVIEQSGYAARIAFILDRFFRAFGLSGKSLLPMIVSCGCTVSGVMATRVIENKSERRATVFLAPFMPCGAKTAVFGWFSYEFFGGSALIATSMYFLALFSVAVFGRILKKFKAFKDSESAFILEMPNLRPPSIKDVLSVLIEKIKDFIFKAGSTVLLVSVALFFLQNFGIKGYVENNVEESFLFFIGNALKFIFEPLGFGNWQASVSVLSGIFAKEAVVETLRQVTSAPETLFYSKFSIYAFMAFILLSPPCLASLVTAKRELNSKKWFIFMLLFQFTAGYLVALLINIIGLMVINSIYLILFLIVGIIILSIVALAKTKKRGCKGCINCTGGNAKCNIKEKRFTT